MQSTAEKLFDNEEMFIAYFLAANLEQSICNENVNSFSNTLTHFVINCFNTLYDKIMLHHVVSYFILRILL